MATARTGASVTADYPRMYTPSGRLLHRSWRIGEHFKGATGVLCARVPWWHPRAVEGLGPADDPHLGEFDPEHASRLAACAKCDRLRQAFLELSEAPAAESRRLKESAAAEAVTA